MKLKFIFFNETLFFYFKNSKLINFSVPKTIDERSLNKGKINNYQQLENLELALRSAEAIGCHVINMRPSDIKEGIEHLILGLLWQIIKVNIKKLLFNSKIFKNFFLKDWIIFRNQFDSSSRFSVFIKRWRN
jgi:hypothetical protein